MAKLKYNEDFPIRAEDYARQGMRDEDIWRSLGVGKNAFYRYQKDYPDFKDALKRGVSRVFGVHKKEGTLAAKLP